MCTIIIINMYVYIYIYTHTPGAVPALRAHDVAGGVLHDNNNANDNNTTATTTTTTTNNNNININSINNNNNHDNNNSNNSNHNTINTKTTAHDVAGGFLHDAAVVAADSMVVLHFVDVHEQSLVTWEHVRSVELVPGEVEVLLRVAPCGVVRSVVLQSRAVGAVRSLRQGVLISLSLSLYISIYIERDIDIDMCIYKYSYLYIYIVIYMFV